MYTTIVFFCQIWLILCKTLIVILLVKNFCLIFTEKCDYKGKLPKKLGKLLEKPSLSKCIKKVAHWYKTKLIQHDYVFKTHIKDNYFRLI